MSSQMIYIMIALFLFMNLVIMANQMISHQMDSVYQSQEYYIAASVAQSIIEEGWLVGFNNLSSTYNNKTFTRHAGGVVFTVKTQISTFTFAGNNNFKLLSVHVSSLQYKIDLSTKFVYADV